jgi:hypothetical protein
MAEEKNKLLGYDLPAALPDRDRLSPSEWQVIHP